MKEHVLQLLEELVGAHTHRVKQEKADEIAALVKTAVFPADQVDEAPVPADPQSPLIAFGDAMLDFSSLHRMSDESPLIPAENAHE